MQLKADNERMHRTIARNGLQDDEDHDTTVELRLHSSEGATGSARSQLQKKLSLEDPTTFGLCHFGSLTGGIPNSPDNPLAPQC